MFRCKHRLISSGLLLPWTPWVNRHWRMNMVWLMFSVIRERLSLVVWHLNNASPCAFVCIFMFVCVCVADSDCLVLPELVTSCTSDSESSSCKSRPSSTAFFLSFSKSLFSSSLLFLVQFLFVCVVFLCVSFWCIHAHVYLCVLWFLCSYVHSVCVFVSTSYLCFSSLLCQSCWRRWIQK